MAGRPEALPAGALAVWATAPASAYFLDVDGTLLGIEPRPEDVVADSALLALLQGLEARAGGAFALVSGRRIDDIDRIFAPVRFPAVGLHGAEMRLADGIRIFADGGRMDEMRPSLRAFVEARDGVWIEDKGATLAVHFRQRPELAGEVLSFLRPLARGGLMVQEGKMVAELRESRHDKGKAIDTLMAIPPFAGRMPIFVGDDVTDESGFEVVNRRGGFSIRVGAAEAETKARFRLADPAELRRELAALLEAG